MWRDESRYEKLEVEESGTDNGQANHNCDPVNGELRNVLTLFKYCCWATVVTTLLVATYLAFPQLSLLGTRQEKHDSPGAVIDCGETPAQAEQKGCRFDLLSYTWIPPQCLDEATSQEFREWLYDPARLRGAWPFFGDEALTDVIPDEKTLSQRVHMWSYTTQEEHMAHCTFMARRLHRAVLGELDLLPSRSESLEHTIHCTNKIMDMFSKPDLNITENLAAKARFGVGFGTCI